MPNWDDDEHGLIILKPLVGWESAVLAGMGCGLRLQFVHHPDDIGKSSESIQFGMMPQQARELAQALIELAERAEAVPPGTALS
jgi:hypothetical protein